MLLKDPLKHVRPRRQHRIAVGVSKVERNNHMSGNITNRVFPPLMLGTPLGRTKKIVADQLDRVGMRLWSRKQDLVISGL